MVTLAFDDFGWAELKSEANAAGCSVQELLQRAVGRFTEQLDSGGGWVTQVPELARRPGWRPTTRVEIELTCHQAEQLGMEAQRQGVSLPRLVVHAVIVYLATV